MIKLGVIGKSFPHPVRTIELKNNNPELVSKLKLEFSEVFTDAQPEEALKGPKMKIHLTDNAVTRAVATTRPIPLHWKEEAEKTMKKLLDRGVIERVPIEEPCEWVSPGFFVPKADGKSPRMVTDFSYLNQFVKRPFHLFPSAQEIMQAIPAKSTVFEKLDAVWGYHQIPLDIESRKLTTFLLPSGQYRYARGPMGLSSTNDEWCFRSDFVISDIPGCNKIVDDVLVAAPDYKTLKIRVRTVLE